MRKWTFGRNLKMDLERWVTESLIQSKTSVQEDDTLKREEEMWLKKRAVTTKNIKIKEKIEMKNNMVICWWRDKILNWEILSELFIKWRS